MPRMSLTEHLVELRVRLVKAALALVVGMGVSFWNWAAVKDFVMEPYVTAARGAGLPDARLSVLDPGDGFLAVMKLCFLVGFVLASPVVIWQLWGFIAAGLYENERRAVRLFFPVALGLFALGVVSAYLLLIPFGLAWLIDFNVHSLGANSEFSVASYTSLCVSLVFAMGLSFQLPLVMLFLQGSGIVQRATFKRYWRHAVVGAFVVGMILTADPSPVTQTLMSIPLCGLYMLGIWGGRFVGDGKERFRWWKAWPVYLGLALFVALLLYNKELVAWWNSL
jgi:sec-independent protein translocase protein TatC